MKLSVNLRGRTRSVELHVEDSEATIFQIKEQLAVKLNLSIVRQRLTYQNTPLLDDKRTLKAYSIPDKAVLTLKDVGPQISWKTVFYIEYLGPMAIHQLAMLLKTNFVRDKYLSTTQLLGYIAVTLHFLKREYETAFVHRFSHATMPLANLAKNCAHYWLLSGLLVAYELYFFSSATSTAFTWLWFLAFLGMELGNFKCHVMLRDLRPKGTNERAIPRGFLFDLVSCPNYLCESGAWLAFALMTRCWSSWVFFIVGTVQMYLWAEKKHRAYKKEFDDYPTNRKAMFPFIL